MATTLIADLLTSWNNPNEAVDVEVSTAPQTYQWTKGQVRAQFRSNNQPLICCPFLPAPALQYYMDQDPFWLAHRILFQSQFVSAARFTTNECYFLAEEGEPTVQLNGRPLSEAERWQLHHEPEKMDMKDFQPTELKMKKGIVMRIPPYTVYCFLVADDSLITTGGIVPRGFQADNGMMG